MPAAEVVERLVAVRLQVDRACDLLISLPRRPGFLLAPPRNGVFRLAQLQPRLCQGAGNPAAKEEARRLRAAIMCAGRLLETP